ncbi:MAG: DUF4173 domain-containing protein [Ruminococcus sp.]|nr:DUF4173 domain-containing protein [Ruminococcus sp.]
MTDNTENGTEIFFEEAELSPELSEKEAVPEYTRDEFILSLICFILAFGFVKLVVFCTTGFITTLLYAAIITVCVVYLRKKGCKFGKLNTALTGVLYVFSLVFSITDNGFIKDLASVFLFIAGAYLVYSVSAGKKDIERYLPFALERSVFGYPFTRFGAQFSITRSAMGDSRVGSTAKPVILGLLIAVPLTAIVGALLMSADAGLDRLFSGILEKLSEADVPMLILQLAIAVPCSMYLFGMLYANCFRDKADELDENDCRSRLEAMRFVRNLVIYSAVTPILLLYVMFFVSQLTYFLSAFTGTLPDGYSYSDYARRGFFELLAVTVINLAVMITMNLHAKDGGEHKPGALKFYTSALCISTLILIAAAVSKMILYISEYGLTRLRFYTTWFMLLCAVIFVLVIIRQFRHGFRFSFWVSLSFTILLGVLCFCRPDSLIATYNVEMYRSGHISELDTNALLSLSDDGILTALRLGAVTDEEAESRISYRHEDDPYSVLNISSFILESELE